ncbi:hypothetical protein [Halocella sp. SP3-1]|uniref:hypothetical protein n=1 Tax=Halocella sp. SP3-1 TaxID=2382161 RepID=UPI000F756400|nr:hypothetical protein [Halocella sp. SP3-1]AZO93558.1 hypothetical protein D7D81_02510 [Halocella sp. SP3-1]
MPLSVNTLEATDIQSNQMTLNGEVTDIGGYDLILGYFEYGHKPDLSDAVKSTKCVLLDRLEGYFFVQDNIDDNSVYYYKSAVQNFKETESQMNYLENLFFFNNSIDYFNNTLIADVITNNSKPLTQLIKNKEAVYNFFASDNLEMLWIGDINGIGEGYINLYSEGSWKEITIINKINLTNINTIYIDWEFKERANYDTMSMFILDENIELSRRDNFDRVIQAINVDDYNDLTEIKIKIRGHNKYYPSKVNVYGIWGE